MFVCDSGIGIEKDNYNIIFEEFQQLNNHSRDRSKGLGLGLSIVTRLIDLLGLSLNLESTPGKGSAFSIACPRSDLAEDAPLKNLSFTGSDTLADKNIIIIEDEEEIRHALNMLLSSWGCNVFELASMSDIKQNLSFSNKPDLILADYRLANHQTGVELIHAIHEIYQDKKIPAVVITGDTAPERIKDIEKSRFKIMHKPVAGGKLRAMLNALLLQK